MVYPVDVSSIDESIEYYNEVVALKKEAEEFLLDSDWCGQIYKGWLFTNIGKVLCVFLYEIENTQSPEDKLLWMICGDFPCIYLDTFHTATTKEAIETYIDLALDWLEKFENGQSLEECFPFEIPEGNVELFKHKVSSLNNIILPNIDELSYQLATG